MNLFDLYKNFCELLNKVELDTKTQALYFNLLNIFNLNYFPNELVIKTSELLNILHINKRSFLNSRNMLISLNLIRYTQTNKFINGVYSLVNFNEWCQNALVQNSTTKPTTHYYNKNNKLKLNEREPTLYIDTNNAHTHARDKNSLSQKQLIFAKSFPNKIIDCDIPNQIDIELLISKIKESQFLSTCDNISLKFFIKHYEQIINNAYKDFNKKIKALDFEQREYTEKDFEQLFENLKEVKI